MNLTTVVTSLSKGMQGMVRTINTLPVMVATATNAATNDIDIDKLLKGDGAASSSLKGVGDAVESYGKGFYSIGRNGAIYFAAIALLLFFIGMIVKNGDSVARKEKKDAAPWLAVGIIGVFAVGALLVFFQKIGSNLL